MCDNSYLKPAVVACEKEKTLPVCPKNLDEICASDGTTKKTYSSRCMFCFLEEKRLEEFTITKCGKQILNYIRHMVVLK